MAELMETVQTDVREKKSHVPVIDCPDKVESGKVFNIRVTLGKDISHPNTPEHHISWLTIYFIPSGEKFNDEARHFEFNAYTDLPEGFNKRAVYTNYEVKVSFKVSKPGTIYALSYCTIHGLWTATKEISIIPDSISSLKSSESSMVRKR